MNKKMDIKQFDEEGYAPVVRFEKWRVAILNYIDELLPEKINNFQKHNETDEVFVLLNGKCILFLADVEKNTIGHIEAVNMLPNKIYTIKKGVYHTHTLSKDAKILIVENDDTCDDNSPKISIGEDINQQLVALTRKLWK